MIYTTSFPIQFAAKANPEAVVTAGKARFTVLTPRLLRLEFSQTAVFEDRPSQAFWYRAQPVPKFETWEEDGRFHLATAHLHLTYRSDADSFVDALTITLAETNTTWTCGQTDPLNLKGTIRTLDTVDGVIALEEGLFSRSGWTVYDDSARLVFDESGWLANRDAPAGYQDLYFFGYGTDFHGCLRDFAQVAGPAPMIPRWALGNWWSRYWAYSEDELMGLMDEFGAHGVPLSVCIVDMDWHITNTGNRSSGWTGYTWNRDLFPDPPAFMAALHNRGLKTALNLHPADGVHSHEAQYVEMAVHMDIDPEMGEPVPFAIADPHFTQAYFEKLHHPQEADGADFWWIDWQQGTVSGLPGLDPLWWLNHLHFYDLRRGGEKRPFIFSRWGGLGNHRYPIGFSGDTVVSWASLAFQPYFTATAANVNYGWWSHDIGGHMGGVEEPELYLRWVQYGVFSPILRLHCTNNPFHERRPWGYDAEIAQLSGDAMRLRHRLIPYIYAMAWHNHMQHLPLIRSMYVDHPQEEAAYHCPDQYWFGTELVAAPFITPIHPETQLSRQVVWLPKGDWFDFFSGMPYAGDGWYAVYGRLSNIPVFAKAGAIVPLAGDGTRSYTEETQRFTEGSEREEGLVNSVGVENPEVLELHLFPGADNAFGLYEDDGLEAQSIIPIESRWSPQAWTVTMGQAAGETGHLPAQRTVVFHFRNVAAEISLTVRRNDEVLGMLGDYDENMATLRVTAVSIHPGDTLTITLSTNDASLIQPQNRKLAVCRMLVRAFRMDTWVKDRLFKHLPTLIENPAALAHFKLSLTEAQQRALLEVITEAGLHHTPTRCGEEQMIVLWNNQAAEGVRYHWHGLTDRHYNEAQQNGRLPRFGCFVLGDECIRYVSKQQPASGRITIEGWLAAAADNMRAELIAGVDAVVQFEIGGENGFMAYLVLDNGQAVMVNGNHSKPDVTIAAQTSDWLSLINGDITPEELFLGGKLNIQGDLNLLLKLVDVIQVTPAAHYRPEKWQFSLHYADLLSLSLGQ